MGAAGGAAGVRVGVMIGAILPMPAPGFAEIAAGAVVVILLVMPRWR